MEAMLNIVTYSMMCYAITAVISFLVMAVIVAFSKMLTSDDATDESQGE